MMAAGWFGQMAASRITWDRLGPLTLIPVPDAACGLSAERVPKVVPLAEALAGALPAGKATVLDVLRWARPMPTAHQADGTRDPQELYGRLRLSRPKLPAHYANAVLVDDVLASGGHLRAAAAFLRDCGAHVVAAVCAGRADDAGAGDLEPFKTRTDLLPDFVSDPDWLLPLVYDGVDL
jgi:predicted amidophosphoribosyltransferase